MKVPPVTCPLRTEPNQRVPLPLRQEPRSSRRAVSCLAVAAVMVAASVAPLGCGDNPTAPIAPTAPQQSVRDQCLARAVFGNPAASAYILPYPVGASYSLLQTYCGPQNHGRDNQLAYDFTIPFGDPVVAARSGTVRRVVDTYADDDRVGSHNNHMFIEHADGTTAMYAHLVQHSVAVQDGDWVEQGQLIALSGTSGGTVAVLHFGVYRTWPNQGGDDVAVNFRNAEGPIDERGGLVQGAAYTALPVVRQNLFRYVVRSIYSSGIPNLIPRHLPRQHPGMLLPFFRCLVSALKTRRALALENLALRRQLAVLRRSVKRPRLSDFDRGFWVLLSRIWRDWKRSLVLVKPETVIQWHRSGFRRQSRDHQCPSVTVSE